MIKAIYYKVLDLLNGGKGIMVNVSGLKLRLPTRYHKYYQADYEKENIEYMQTLLKPGQNVLDIGAQMGLMTKLYCDQVGDTGKVFAFEPTPKTYDLLKKTIEINNLTNAIPVKKAVSDKVGKTVFHISTIEASAANSLAPGGNNKDTIAIDVELTSIDAFVKEQNISKLHFVKIDAEGAEFAILKGAVETVKRDKPEIMLGIHPVMLKNFGDNIGEIYDYCLDLGYTVYYHDKVMTKEDFTSRTKIFDAFLK